MEKKIDVGKEVFVYDGRKEKGKVMKRTTTLTRYIGGGSDVREIYLIKIGDQEIEFNSEFVFEREIDLANYILMRNGICKQLRFKSFCEKCNLVSGCSF